jgi:hypothetical protein
MENITQRLTAGQNFILLQFEYFVLFRHKIKSYRDERAGIFKEDVAYDLKDPGIYHFTFVYLNGGIMPGML